MRITWILVAIASLLSVASPAWAGSIRVTNTTTASTLFSDDGFEDDTVGTNPNAPLLGSWVKPAQTTTGALVINDAIPGPFDGSNYLRINRTGATNTAQIDEVFEAALPIGETMSATFAFQYATGTSSVAIQLRSGASTSLATIFAEPDFGAPNFYAVNSSGGGPVNSSRAVTPGAWQTIGIQYTAGSSDLTLTVNGTSETLVGAVTGGTVDRIRFGTAAGGTKYYVDAVPVVPEPAGWTLAAMGLVSLLLIRGRTRT